MPRIRTVKPKFWDDIKLSKVSRDARLLFIGMWNFSDDCGVIMGEPVWIKSKIFPYDILSNGELEIWMKELRDISVIVPGVFREEVFYLIRNFTRHQVINKPNKDDLCIPKDCISDTFDKSGSNPVAIPEQYGSSPVAIRGGKEGKGREEEGKGEEVEPPNVDQNFTYDAEKEVLASQIYFERICMNAKKFDLQAAKFSLRKFHLHLEANAKYPQTRKQVFAGFEKWLLNEKISNNGKSGNGNGSVGKTIEFDQP